LSLNGCSCFFTTTTLFLLCTYVPQNTEARSFETYIKVSVFLYVVFFIKILFVFPSVHGSLSVCLWVTAWIKNFIFQYQFIISRHILSIVPLGDCLRPHTHRGGLQEPLRQLFNLNLAPGSTWQPSYRNENHHGQRNGTPKVAALRLLDIRQRLRCRVEMTF
jgi:hypothetical protein